MENVVLTIHLILAVLLTGVVLLQRSEGGGLGMGGGGGVMTGRQAANALTRLTWIFGIALFVTSIALTIIAARQVSNSSIMDQLGVPASRQQDPNLPAAPTYVPPPSTGTAGDPLTPPAPEPAAPPAGAGDTPGAAAPAAQAPASPAPAAEAVAPPPAEPVTPAPVEPGSPAPAN
ncbi:preprotein translocase subunit SecG [Paracoccus subflavus]|uniref:Protein-export membrane protein SecG n=1 Tax=Paracoccus subflavus TaxID=2528244 RepID=A0A4V6MTC6_9RHOB|nr:preprotein translocase subunit SecG [Paracoccus subflavus]TBN39473.1 preprotein translocase subunit SecG [Paracoccus subflavus]